MYSLYFNETLLNSSFNGAMFFFYSNWKILGKSYFDKCFEIFFEAKSRILGILNSISSDKVSIS